MDSPSKESVREVMLAANEMRRDIVRMIASAGSGHPGGSLSCCDILATLLFGGVMRYDHADPTGRSGDRLLLSKGHAAPALYAAYARLGWVEKEELLTLRRLGSRLQGHPDSKLLPAVEVCSGSLGQGLAVGTGLAFALYQEDVASQSPRRVFVVCGDGEMQEGSVWEALALASHLGLSNLTLIIDRNNLQIDGRTEDVCALGEITNRVNAFGWHVSEIDGHDIGAMIDLLADVDAREDRPFAVVCHTTKGKGVSIMENKAAWHGRAPLPWEERLALDELSVERERILEEVRDGATSDS